jgi:hypothetical protein
VRRSSIESSLTRNKYDPFVKSHIVPSPVGRGQRGGGENQFKYQDFHPHPSFLPYREREHFGLLTKESNMTN